jgi:hypothetical protein
MIETFWQVKLLTIWDSNVDDHGWSIDLMMVCILSCFGLMCVLFIAVVFLVPNGVLFAPVSLT